MEREERGVEGWGNLTDIDITLFVSIATISSINRNIYCPGLYEDQCPSLSQQSYECQAPFWLSEELKEFQSVVFPSLSFFKRLSSGLPF